MARFAVFAGGLLLVLGTISMPAVSTQDGAISGVVIAEGEPGDGEPIEGVTVAVTNGRQAQNTSTNERGQFSFGGLAPGRYIIRVAKQGYLAMELGAFRPGEPGTPVEVASDRTATVMARLPRPAWLSGTVVGPDGTPAVDVGVTARLFALAGTSLGTGARTDISGAFQIDGLAAGDYVLTASQNISMRTERSVTHFPGVTSPERAQRITLHAGDGKELTALKLLPADARITGTVSSPSGAPQADASISIHTKWDRVATGKTGPDGRFEVIVAAGEYEVIATHGGGPVPADPARKLQTSMPVAFWMKATTQVAAQSTAIVALPLKPAPVFAGSTTGDTDAAPEGSISLKTGGRTSQVVPITNGRFAFDRMAPGDYGLTVILPSESPWWLKTATADGRSLLAGPLVLAPRPDITDAVLTMSRERGDLSGTLNGRNGLPQTEYWVAVIPIDASVRHPESPQILRTRPATNGRFVFERMPAGQYALAVFGDLGDGEWRTPEILSSLVAGGIKVTVAAGASIQQDVRIER